MTTVRVLAVAGLALASSGCATFATPAKLTAYPASRRSDRDAEYRMLDFKLALVSSDNKRIEVIPDGNAIQVAPGNYQLYVGAQCQPDFTLPVNIPSNATVILTPDTYSGYNMANEWLIAYGKLPTPPREPKYLKYLKSDTVGQSLAVNDDGVRSDQPVKLPKNAEVYYVRRWPRSNGQCSDAMISVANAGPGIEGGALLAVDEALLADAPSGPTMAALAKLAAGEKAAEKAAQKATQVAAEKARRDEEAKRRAAAQAAAGNDEVRTGRCRKDRHAALQQALQWSSNVLEGMRSSNEYWYLVAHDTVIATEKGTMLTMNAGAGGQLHFFAVSLSQVKLDVKDRRGMSSSLTDPYEVVVANGVGGLTDSRLIRANVGERMDLTVKGAGCTLVMAFRTL